MKLTDLQYGVLIQALHNVRNEVAEDTFIDPYANEEGHTNEMITDAVNELEVMIMDLYAQQQ